MESQQSVMLQNPSELHASSKSGSSSEVRNSTWDFGVHEDDTMSLRQNSKEFIGVVEVFIHQARDIHNICIYHKQDVYAKLCLTSDPDTSASTQIVNGGGKNPVFNENLSLNVQTVDSSVKCEIWMLSRVRNYLEDQLLGFTLVPLSEVLGTDCGNLSKEFTLSSTDLFHSPAGFVQLSLSYIGASPDVLEISVPHRSSNVNGNGLATLGSPEEELEKLEFPDPKVLNENHLMVSEYFEMSCTNLHAQNSAGMEAEDKGVLVKSIDSASVDAADSFSGEINVGEAPVQASRAETITSSVSTNGSPTLSAEESGSSRSVCENAKQPNGKPDVGEAESGSSNIPTQDFAKLAVSVPVEPEQKDYVDMYLKSMQQFTDSLAKMKLPFDLENSSGSVATDSNSPASNGKGPKVFYGSRAFF
uniref:C2 domain-containing protein n=1 Tax=Kalanchoe fedtschenkoi TaxID=63787 RepID=A0A7N0TUC9_KALFE